MGDGTALSHDLPRPAGEIRDYIYTSNALKDSPVARGRLLSIRR